MTARRGQERLWLPKVLAPLRLSGSKMAPLLPVPPPLSPRSEGLTPPTAVFWGHPGHCRCREAVSLTPTTPQCSLGAHWDREDCPATWAGAPRPPGVPWAHGVQCGVPAH